MKPLTTMAAALVAIALLVPPAHGQDAATEQRIKELERKVAELMKIIEKQQATQPAAAEAASAQQVQELQKQVDGLQAIVEEKPDLKLATGVEIERTMEPVVLRSFYDNGYLVWSSRDGDFKYWLDGRMNLDYAEYSGAENRLPGGFEVRRARIGVKATLFEDWLAEIDLDFADNAVEIKDLWAGYAGFNHSLIRLGNHKAPFGLETLTSSKYISFIERAYIDSWAPDRRLGLSYSRWGEKWQFSVGMFGPEAGAFNDKDTLTGGGAGTEQDFSPVGRFTFAPLNEKGRVLHFGVAATRRYPDLSKITTSGADLVDRVDASRIVKLDSRAETHPLRAKFLSTGDMKYVDYFDQYGLELLGVFGPILFQAEYQMTDVNRIATNVAAYRDHEFDGYYGQVMWMVTGESRPYYASEGELGRVVPTRRGGALELGLRYSTMDLNDLTTVDPIKGGSAENLTFGANWYINANHKLMLNITQVDNDEYAKPGKDWAPIPPGTSTSQVPVYNDDFTTFALRYALAF